MRAAEALIAGSTLLHPLRGIFLTADEQYGCALGMIGKANGNCASIVDAVRNYPWMRDIANVMYAPCGCFKKQQLIPDIIAHLFDHHGPTVEKHVCYEGCVTTDRTWTLEQIADWLESVDPTPKEEHAGDDGDWQESLPAGYRPVRQPTPCGQ